MNLATKDIRHNLGRFALTAVGIGMLLMVVMGMGGIYRGIIDDATLLVDQVGADLWVVQRNTRGPFAEISRIPPNVVHRAYSVPGVASAREFVFHTIQREKDDRLLRIAVMGLSWPVDRGEWIPLVQGRPLRQNHFEMIANDSLGLPLGTEIPLGKETYSVVGITRNMLSSNGDGMAFVTVRDALAIQFDMSGEGIRLERKAREARGLDFELTRQQPTLLENARLPSRQLPAIALPQLSSVMINVAPGFDEQRVANLIRGWGDVSVFTREDQRDLLLRGMVEKVRQQIGLFRALLTVIAGIIMALILYTLTLDKVHSIALLKLIGAPNSVILGLILQQALLLGALGYLIAYLIGQRIFPLFPRRVVIHPDDLFQLALIVFAISIASSALGIWKALRVSPNEALS
jgi:putative ABC transport system permease protein